jgi:hypothetical protein
MGFFETLVRALIYILFMALAFYLCIWVLGVVGFMLPPMIEKILIAIFVLVAILILARLFYPFMEGYNWFPPRRPPNP